jgi:hypothetical protein
MKQLLRHAVATVAYRAGKVLRDAPPDFAAFRPVADVRSPVEILAHMGDLFDWAIGLVEGRSEWHDATPLPWDDEVARFFACLGVLDRALSSDAALGFPAEAIFQGPIADALTHVGQIALLRRMAAKPIRGENYLQADIAAGRVGPDQAPARKEFD